MWSNVAYSGTTDVAVFLQIGDRIVTFSGGCCSRLEAQRIKWRRLNTDFLSARFVAALSADSE